MPTLAQCLILVTIMTNSIMRVLTNCLQQLACLGCCLLSGKGTPNRGQDTSGAKQCNPDPAIDRLHRGQHLHAMSPSIAIPGIAGALVSMVDNFEVLNSMSGGRLESTLRALEAFPVRMQTVPSSSNWAGWALSSQALTIELCL